MIGHSHHIYAAFHLRYKANLFPRKSLQIRKILPFGPILPENQAARFGTKLANRKYQSDHENCNNNFTPMYVQTEPVQSRVLYSNNAQSTPRLDTKGLTNDLDIEYKKIEYNLAGTRNYNASQGTMNSKNLVKKYQEKEENVNIYEKKSYAPSNTDFKKEKQGSLDAYSYGKSKPVNSQKDSDTKKGKGEHFVVFF